MGLYINSEVAVQKCYIIITSEVDIVNPFKSTRYLVELETLFFNIFLSRRNNNIPFLFEENGPSRSADNFWVTSDPMDVKVKKFCFYK